jgi:hypothetical protein
MRVYSFQEKLLLFFPADDNCAIFLFHRLFLQIEAAIAPQIFSAAAGLLPFFAYSFAALALIAANLPQEPNFGCAAIIYFLKVKRLFMIFLFEIFC